ncbi:polysaccharide pyruvyl transferase family protein [Rubrivivax sp. JA1055]|uniref:polysaccharide pyruvyl transferase family protein n=1 Tax=Rubrivivax sp. JA1055 TaxID=2894194 RepID=UPI001E3D2253|nr:polysaccharide pyruvyl transferase family protein [Rubrivivax sp. JA1055]MCC9596343.1 polysaccharide pyruvyl transferase family protein [Rubrivivax sp. JA1055]
MISIGERVGRLRLYYYRHPSGNFGDDLNLWLWPRLLGPTFFDDDPDELLVGIGTLLNHRVPVARRTLVFGAGHGYGTVPSIDDRWHFFCVRGPLTARALGLPPELAVTDPAILVADSARALAAPVPGRVGFMPHCDSAEAFDWAAVAHDAGLHYIDPRHPVDTVLRDIGRCEKLVSEAMHGAIVADALRVPWIAVRAYPHIADFKWQDWTEAMRVRYCPDALQPLWSLCLGLPWRDRAKQAVKRRLFASGLYRADWEPPLPKCSPPEEREAAVAALRRLSSQGGQLSDPRTHDARLASMHTALEALRQHGRAALAAG